MKQIEQLHKQNEALLNIYQKRPSKMLRALITFNINQIKTHLHELY